jgi:DNA-binding transcriptional regulator YiaG
MPRTLRHAKRGRSKPQPAARRHDQYDVTPAPQDARRRRAQVVFELLQEPERPADVPRRRVCEMTRHHAGNLGQIALFDKSLPEVGWGNLPSDRATDYLADRVMPMSPQQFRDALRRLRLSQVQAAKRLSVNERTVRRWVAGDSRIPESVALLMHTWLRTRPRRR